MGNRRCVSRVWESRRISNLNTPNSSGLAGRREGHCQSSISERTWDSAPKHLGGGGSCGERFRNDSAGVLYATKAGHRD